MLFLIWRQKGRNRQLKKIVEIVAQVLDPFGNQIEDDVFQHFLRPKNEIPSFITQLTTMVSGVDKFVSVADAFIRFMQQVAYEYLLPNDHIEIDHVILVAHNGKCLILPTLFNNYLFIECQKNVFADNKFGIVIDTLQVARDGIQTNPSHGIPSAFVSVCFWNDL
jgi:DNA polymerase III alpha subunit (gram-positive type)